MKTVLLQANQIQTAATILKQGGLVVFPTETVYGLGARGDNPEAVQKIFRAKGRPSDNPLILHVASLTDVPALVTHISQEAQQLMATFWPGPLTLLFPKSKAVLMDVTAGLSTVAIRMPDHPVARALIEAVGVAVAAPSANVSGRPSSTSFVHVMDDLDGVVEAMIDGGDSVIGIESTVLDVSVSPPVLYRPGAITKVQIETVLKRSISLGTSLNQTKSPGTKYAHYQPQATLTLVLGSKAASMQWLQQSVASTIICPSDWATALTGRNLLLLGHSEEAKSIAQGLYAMLRSLDHNGVQEAVVLLGSKESLGDALVDRLGKAAGGRVKELLE